MVQFKRAEGVSLLWLDEENAVVENPALGLVHVVNHVAGKVLELMDSRTSDQIAELLAGLYSVEARAIVEDVRKLLEEYESLHIATKHTNL